MKFLNGVKIPSITSSMLKTDSGGAIVAATGGSDYLRLTDIYPYVTVASGRLSLSSSGGFFAGSSSGTTLYLGQHNGNVMPLWNSTNSAWEYQTFGVGDHSITISGASLAANTMYDIFATNNNNGTFSLTATAWTNFGSRATPIILQNGVYVQFSAPQSRYLGTVMTDATPQFVDTYLRRLIWNQNNRLQKRISSQDGSSATYTLVGGAGTWQYCRNAATTSQVQAVFGQPFEPMLLQSSNYASLPSGVTMGTGMNVAAGVTSVSTTNTLDGGFATGNNSAGSIQTGAISTLVYPVTAAGQVTITQVEYGLGGTVTFYPGATNTNIAYKSAITGIMWC